MAAYQPTLLYLTLRGQNCGSGLAREGGLAVNTVGLGTYPLLR